MPDPSDPATTPKPSRPRRTKKFVLPDHHHDEREGELAAEYIEAFLEGPVPTSGRRAAIPERIRRPVELDTRHDWTAALQREAARHARYGRPASVLLIELDGAHPVAVDRTARVLTTLIGAQARETDRAARLSAGSFRLLLPETGGRAARTFAERLDRAFRRNPDGRSTGVDLCIEVATAPPHGTLEDAVIEAERRLAARAEAS